MSAQVGIQCFQAVLDTRFRALLSGIFLTRLKETLQGKAVRVKTLSANSTAEPATCLG
jgi:hypothetical protein